jgi:hypothetical protein
MSLVNTFSLAGREESLQKSTYLSERLIANNGRKVLGGRLRQGTQLHTQE